MPPRVWWVALCAYLAYHAGKGLGTLIGYANHLRRSPYV